MGLGGAIVLLVLALFTDVLRHETGISRWRDPVWLAWASVIAYMLHNFEEYGIDLLGRPFQFPATACETFGFPDVVSCPLVPSFFVAVNIPFVWIALVAAALIARKVPAVGLTGAGLLLTNALSHVATLPTPMGYSPGTLTAVLLFIPLAVWVFATQFGRGKQRIPVLIVILAASILAQLVLLLLLAGLSNDVIALSAAIVIQTVDPVLLILLPWLAHRQWPSRVGTFVAEGEG
ncbi:HXXEE domain-containing protein [Brachybacterium epidermidis]|uniref:HXXEE domain-containing protein n=1 Tax=Brachybacterium epidermidis TaxID=2781983 RepID=UPI0032B7E903